MRFLAGLHKSTFASVPVFVSLRQPAGGQNTQQPSKSSFYETPLTDKNFANDLLSSTSTAATRKAALTAMGFNPAAISAAEAVVNTPGFRANLDALITNMTLAPAGVTTGQSLRN